MQEPLLSRGSIGAEDGIRTRDPHLGKKSEDGRPASPPAAITCTPVHVLSAKYAPVHPVRRVVYVRVLTITRF